MESAKYLRRSNGVEWLPRHFGRDDSGRQGESARPTRDTGTWRTPQESRIRAGLFGAGGQDVFALDLDFHADGRANIAALDDGAANPEIAGKIGGL
jgi:hypothetical protein